MIASSEDVDQAKLEAFEKNHAKNRSNSGMKFSRRGSMWKNANKGWNTTALKDIDPSIEQNSKILKSKPKWGSYSTRGVCNYVSPRGPPGSLGKPPRPFTPCWAYDHVHVDPPSSGYTRLVFHVDAHEFEIYRPPSHNMHAHQICHRHPARQGCIYQLSPRGHMQP